MRELLFGPMTLLLVVAHASAQVRVSVQDSKIRATLHHGFTVITLPLASTLQRPTPAHLALQWLDPKGAVAAKVESDLIISPGARALDTPFPLPDAPDPLWLRLTYRLSPGLPDPTAFAPVNGTLALPEIADYPFELQLATIGFARPGHPLIVRAHAIHPVTASSVPGVKFEATLNIANRETPPRSTTRDSLGFVTFTFDLPATLPDDSLTVDIDASLGDYSQSNSASVNILNRSSATLQTDKPIYQPGQTLHIRGVVLGPDGHAADGEQVELTLDDPESDTAHHVTLTSSKFGVVHDDWKLPSSAALGDWNLRVTLKDDSSAIAEHRIRVSRYELPSFTVSVTPDHDAYLPGQPVRITVQGTYLFGKPVPKGKVRIVRSDGENEVAQGEADEAGKFTTSLKLDDDRADLKAIDRDRFRDLNFTASYTDPSTLRKEQRRFDIRLTREPIHVYIIRPIGPAGPLPTPAYIATYYANGKPAMTHVEIKHLDQTVQVRTNRFGVARALLTNPGGEVIVHATDDAGLSGEWRDQGWYGSKDGIRVETDKSIYREGETVRVRVTSSEPELDVMVDAAVEGAPAASRSVHLTNGRGEMEFPYAKSFRRQVVFVAWTDRNMNSFWAHKAVVFPTAADLRVSVTPEKAEYRPGDRAGVTMKLALADGHPVAGVFGAAVVDQAVMERARTDSEFGHRPWFSCGFCPDAAEALVGGVSLNDIYNLDLAKPLPDGLDLVAEILLANEDAAPRIESGERYEVSQRMVFAKLIQLQFENVRRALDEHYSQTLGYPRNEDELERVWRKGNPLQDPWGTPYRPRFFVNGANDVLQFVSDGPDKRPGTKDDFVAWEKRWPWFRLQQKLIGDILAHGDYPATPQEFSDLLERNGIRLDTLPDRWGHSLRTRISNWTRTRTIELQSAGPDGKFNTPDDVEVCRFQGPYFQRESAAIDDALRNAHPTPVTEAQVRELIQRAGVDLSTIRDPWGHPYSITLRTSSRYTDRSRFTDVKVYQGTEQTRQDITPVTERFLMIALRSNGPDGVAGTYDDFDVADFTLIVGEEAAPQALPQALPQNPTVRLPGTGRIIGRVTDASGAVVPHATVKLLEPASGETKTNEDGAYAFLGLPPGQYSLRFEASGFRSGEVVRVPVGSGHTTVVDYTLQVGNISQSVVVTADAGTVQTSSGLAAALAITATPRVRDYFPETLLWAPEVETDKLGRAHLGFKLADNVTTWKVAVFASTEDGRTATTEADLLAFQPFFIDHNPPPVLTSGDEISLPVTVRNYLSREQKVSVEMQPNAWSELRSPARQLVNVQPNGFSNVIYSLRANAPEDSAHQRITAIAAKENDAIEKTLRVHPDGQEVTQTLGDVAVGRSSLKVTIPASAISGATRGELRVYPSLFATLRESLDGIIQRPYGCAEQTTSAGYANLIALEFARAAGHHDPMLEARALQFIGEARDRLMSFAAPTGGIRYWGRGDSDAAVTTYALMFLIAASQFVEMDRDDLQSHLDWLQKQPPAQSPLLSALSARTIAAAQKAKLEVSATFLAEALHDLARRIDSRGEPYLLASFALAAIESGNSDLARTAIAQLEKTAQQERDGLFWELESNTPFYGWGTAGRMETSALAISALVAWRQGHPEDARLDPIVRRGLLFLLRHRDRYGVWYSTQATMRAMRAISEASAILPGFSGQGGSLEVRVNGKVARTIQLPAGLNDPILIDVSPQLAAGDNELELIPSNGGGANIVRLVTTHWTPWTGSPIPTNGELRLAVNFSTLAGRVGSAIQCHVEAERVGFRGHGMMLAEIGLPPGAEVDRASLDEAGVDHYDILPDRVVFYLWPKAGGSKFSFSFTPRFAMTARSASAVLYDYYNPDARTEAPPRLFRIQ